MVFLPGAALDGVTCSFDKEQKLLALASNDGRVKVFDAASGELRIEFRSGNKKSKDPIDSINCLAWGVQALGKDKATAAHSDSLVLGAGNASGDVIAYALATGKIAWRATAVVQGPVHGLLFNTAKQTYLAAGKDGTVVVIDGKTGKRVASEAVTKHELSCATAVGDGALSVVAGSGLYLLDSSEIAVAAKMAGHATAVRALAATPDGSYVLSAAQGDRSIAIFSLARKATTKQKVRKAKGHLSVEDPAVSLHCCADAESAGDCSRSFQALAVSEGGDAYVWRCSKTDGTVTGQLRAQIQVGAGPQRGLVSGKQDCILAAVFEGDNALLIARGSTVKPHFELVQLPAGMGTTISLKAMTAGLLLDAAEGSAASDKATANGVIVGAENAGSAVKRRELVGSKKRAIPDQQPVDDNFNVPVSDEPSLAERVAALNGVSGAPEPAPKPSTSSGPITADSLSVLLSQALNAEDKVLLERVLSTGNATIIRNTVARLSPMDAAAFLKAAIDRLQTKPARAAMLLPWLRAAILQHASYLSSAPGVQAHLTTLYQLIESRLSVMQPMLALRGRLDVVLAHHDGQNDKEDPATSPGPLINVDVADLKTRSVAEFLSTVDVGHAVEDPYAGNDDDSDEDMASGWETDEGGDEGEDDEGEASDDEDADEL